MCIAASIRSECLSLRTRVYRSLRIKDVLPSSLEIGKAVGTVERRRRQHMIKATASTTKMARPPSRLPATTAVNVLCGIEVVVDPLRGLLIMELRGGALVGTAETLLDVSVLETECDVEVPV